MKKIGILVLTIVLALLFTGCKPLVEETDQDREYRIYASFYPVYALSELIIRENVPDMHLYQLIQPQDGCLRSYSLSDWDLYIAMNADAVVLNGSGLEAFEASLRSLGEDGPAVISATGSMVLLKNEEITNEESHFYGANPWMFLSVDGALEMTRAICANMQTLDPAYAQSYLENLADAEIRFQTLKAEMSEIFEAADTSAPIAVAQEGLIWFADEWNLNCALVIERESGTQSDRSETEEMLREISERGITAVLLEKQAPKSLVNAIESVGCKAVLIDTLSAGNAQNGAQGYFDAMLQNALNYQNALPKEKE